MPVPLCCRASLARIIRKSLSYFFCRFPEISLESQDFFRNFSAAIKVNTIQLRYNWLLGRDIVEMNVEQRWGDSVIEQLSREVPDH